MYSQPKVELVRCWNVPKLVLRHRPISLNLMKRLSRLLFAIVSLGITEECDEDERTTRFRRFRSRDAGHRRRVADVGRVVDRVRRVLAGFAPVRLLGAHEGLDSTLVILQNEPRTDVEVSRDLRREPSSD